MELKDLIIERAMEKVASSMEKEAAALPLMLKGIKTVGQAAKVGSRGAAKALAKYKDITTKIGQKGVGAIPKNVDPQLYAKQLERLRRAANNRLSFLDDVTQFAEDAKIPAKIRNSAALQKLFMAQTNKGVIPFESSMIDWANTPVSQVASRIKYRY